MQKTRDGYKSIAHVTALRSTETLLRGPMQHNNRCYSMQVTAYQGSNRIESYVDNSYDGYGYSTWAATLGIFNKLIQEVGQCHDTGIWTVEELQKNWQGHAAGSFVVCQHTPDDETCDWFWVVDCHDLHSIVSYIDTIQVLYNPLRQYKRRNVVFFESWKELVASHPELKPFVCCDDDLCAYNGLADASTATTLEFVVGHRTLYPVNRDTKYEFTRRIIDHFFGWLQY